MELTKILIVYTGGTFGMKVNSDTGALAPAKINNLQETVPELNHLSVDLSYIQTPDILDSSQVGPEQWLQMNSIIQDNYSIYDGFILLHGTDTMAFSASVLSFLLKGIQKPVIFTGAQLPIGFVRNDARDNLVTAVDFINEGKKNNLSVKEVCICFNHSLLRANRSTKVESQDFAAFESHNYPLLAKAGVDLEFYSNNLLNMTNREQFSDQLESSVGLITFFPGIMVRDLATFFDYKKYKVVILQSYGSGNLPENIFLQVLIKDYIEQGGAVLNVSQCIGGNVEQKKYELGNKLQQIGVIGMSDITLEACIAKSMYALANISKENLDEFLKTNVCGELTSH